MRKRVSKQRRFDCSAIHDLQLNFECRDEIIPILRALQEIYLQPKLRETMLDLIEADVLRRDDDAGQLRHDTGREGFDLWQILVLAAVRLGCNLNYDNLHDLAENHINLRTMMGLGDWQQGTSSSPKKSDFCWQRIRDNICLITFSTIEKISHLIVGAGHVLVPEAARTARGDSFVIETNIHHPTESSLLIDGWELILKQALPLAEKYDVAGFRQHESLLQKMKSIARNIQRIATKKGPNYKDRLRVEYGKLIKQTRILLQRAEQICTAVQQGDRVRSIAILAELRTFMQLTAQVLGTAQRRVMQNESVPNEDKLFSLFEPHTQLYKRGKAGEPIQLGRQLLIFEDGAGFITHHHLLPRDVGEKDVAVEQTRVLQTRLGGKLEEVSFDRGFHSPEIQTELKKIVRHVCLPKPGAKQAPVQEQEADEIFHAAKQRHSGVESAIGALQSGNGCVRCRDRSEVGMERYVALAVLGRNLHIFGKLLIAREKPKALAGCTQRKSAA